MIGAIVGDVVGSRFEFHNHRDKEFPLFTNSCKVTDDSIMTTAIAIAVMDYKEHGRPLDEAAIHWMRRIGQPYKNAGYGGRFAQWMYSSDPKPYGSFGNGAAMRVSACAWAADTMADAMEMSDEVTKVTHNHPEGIKGARAITAAIFMARTGCSKDEIYEFIDQNYYSLNKSVDKIRETLQFDETCQVTVPVAIQCFYESEDFEDCLRLAISVGGDSDTIAAIACSIAEAYYGVPENIREKVLTFVPQQLKDILFRFEEIYEEE